MRRVIRILALVLNVVMACFWLFVSSHVLSEFDAEDQTGGVVIFVVVLAAPVLSIATMHWPPSGRARGL